MAITRRQGAVFASGLVLGAAAVAGAWMLLGSTSSPVPDKPNTTEAAPQSAVLASVQQTACPLQPAAAVAGRKDGQFLLQAELSSMTAAHTASFLVLGKEAAAAGRPRDAEVAFLMSCRVADKLKGAGSVESADAKYQLGWHYARLALDEGSAGKARRAELLRHAELMYADSLNAYLAKYGQAHEKSRFAAEGLASVRQTLAQGQTVQAAPEPSRPAQGSAARTTEPVRSAGKASSTPSQASGSRPQPRQVEVAEAAAPTLQAPSAATRPGPSFNCTKARSVPEKIICSDAELARLDRELGQVYARAKNSTSDGAAFRRRNDQEWRRREATCRDRECLVRWYAQRHDQLMNDINEAGERALPRGSR